MLMGGRRNCEAPRYAQTMQSRNAHASVHYLLNGT
jgi:hypothetical protein